MVPGPKERSQEALSNRRLERRKARGFCLWPKKNAMQKSRGAGRTRTWLALSYLAPEIIQAWAQKTADTLGIGIAYCTHDRDEGKKPHTHIVLNYKSVKSNMQVLQDLTLETGECITANNVIQPARDTRAAIRYLTHLDNPEKTRYDKHTAINWDTSKYEMDEQTPQEQAVEDMRELRKFIYENGIIYYVDLLDAIDLAEEQAETPELKAKYRHLAYAANSKRLITQILALLKSIDTKARRAEINNYAVNSR